MLAMLGPRGLAQTNSPASPKPAVSPGSGSATAKPAAPSTAEEEARVLREAVGSAAGNPQTLITILEQFLTRFPESPQREAVLKTIFKQALQANDPQTAVTYGEKLLDLKLRVADQINVLSTVVDLLGRQSDAASRPKALEYANGLVEEADKMAGETRPSHTSADKWLQEQALTRAAAYSLRARIQAESKQDDQAMADYQKSYDAYPTSHVAERLGDLEAQKSATARALDDYATAFALRDPAADPAQLDELRRKLGSTYVMKNGSEKGLGDLVLERYDTLMRDLRSRFDTRVRPNVETRDPFASVLLRLDGAPVHFSEYRGKVVVMDFWATWCGPCIMEGYLMERIVQAFRDEPSAVFLAVNVDEDRSRVPEFVKHQHWTIPVVYAQGLDNLLEVHALPTLMILDRHGHVIFREEGADPNTDGFVQRIRQALGHPTTATVATP
jgi:thiol-disulfide isomerase/thioredoxin/tetratricopeptide (TPR) repeat protein